MSDESDSSPGTTRRVPPLGRIACDELLAAEAETEEEAEAAAEGEDAAAAEGEDEGAADGDGDDEDDGEGVGDGTTYNTSV